MILVNITKNPNKNGYLYMLMQFSVENFRSIKEEQSLSMVKSASKELSENFFDPRAPSANELLKTAVIYGANASGKSNFLKALLHMEKIIESSFSKKLDEDISVEPFLLDPFSSTQPTTFQIDIIVEMEMEDSSTQPVRIDYGFSANKKKVFEEWLSVYPKGREQGWFHRIYNDETEQYDWIKDSDFFKGQKATWKKNTRPDQLFLSTAVHLNSAQLKPIYDALTKGLMNISDDRISSELSKKICVENKEGKNLFISLMQQADIDVEDIVVEKPKYEIKLPDELPAKLRDRLLKDLSERYEVYFVHLDNQGNEVRINLNQESDGTQKVFEFASLIFSVLIHGGILIIDEFNKSLHPDLVRFLVKLFNSENNKGNGQLIFTTHETSILRKDLLRRDQIWFCEKSKDKATTLYPLTDFSPLKDREDIEECYLHGRYGGKPVIKDFIFTENISDF